MAPSVADKLHYLHIPQAHGGRAEMVRMVYVLSGKPYLDVLSTFAEAAEAVAGKNPFKQFPFVETADGRFVYQALAIMHHVAQGTPAWPSDPDRLTDALAVAIAGYDLYQAFAGFSPNDEASKKKFEERNAPKYFGGLDEIYATRSFAAGDQPTFADCIAYEAVAWCLRRNEVCRHLFSVKPALAAFQARFEAVPSLHDFMARQAAARQLDDGV